ncbi:MAG: hypothetical protein AAB706_01460 [Patescibacteria group bacterium]
MKFNAYSKNGEFSLGSQFNRSRFKDFLRKNDGIRLEITPITPESSKQRRYYHGAVIPLIAYYQEGMHHTNPEDLAQIHEWLKCEFNGEMVLIKGKAHKVGKSTRGGLVGYLEPILDWMSEQGYKTELLNPTNYEYWRDTIFPNGGPENYIDYLVEIKKL